MIDIAFITCFASLLTWSVTDIYFFSIVFDPIRAFNNGWETERNWFVRHFRFMLGCPFCFSHWASAGVMLLLYTAVRCGCLYQGCQLSLITAILLIPAAARLANVLRDITLVPFTGMTTSETAETRSEDKDFPDGGGDNSADISTA